MINNEKKSIDILGVFFMNIIDIENNSLVKVKVILKLNLVLIDKKFLILILLIFFGKVIYKIIKVVFLLFFKDIELKIFILGFFVIMLLLGIFNYGNIKFVISNKIIKFIKGFILVILEILELILDMFIE